MRHTLSRMVLCGALAVVTPSIAHAQTAARASGAQTAARASGDSAVIRSNTVLRVSKWSALAATTALAVYGYSTNRTADRDYATLEQLCVADRDNCLQRTGRAYTDPNLEGRYQNVRMLDHRASAALLASQVGVAGTVLLFVFDLRHNRPPKDIPYTPHGLELVPARDGSIKLRLTLPLPPD